MKNFIARLLGLETMFNQLKQRISNLEAQAAGLTQQINQLYTRNTF